MNILNTIIDTFFKIVIGAVVLIVSLAVIMSIIHLIVWVCKANTHTLETLVVILVCGVCSYVVGSLLVENT